MFDAEHRTLRVIASAEVGPADADDVVQEAAIRAMDKLRDYTPGTNFRAWMAAFVRYTASNHKRSERRRSARRLRLAGMSSRHDQASTPPTDTRFDACLQRALDQIPSEQRVCLLLKVVLSHSYEEIGRILELPEATARSHVFRARKRMLELVPREVADGG